MVDERDARIARLQNVLDKERIESENKLETARRQQAESKQKAKAIIQKQGEELRAKIKALEADSKFTNEELSQLKNMLRLSEDEKETLLKQAAFLKTDISDLNNNVKTLERECDDVKENSRVNQQKLSDVENERLKLVETVSDLRQELAASTTVEVSGGGARVEVKDGDDSGDVIPKDADKEILTAELIQLRQRSELLARQLAKANADLDARNLETGALVKDLKESNSKLQKQITETETRVTELQSELLVAEEEVKKANEIASQKMQQDTSNTHGDSSNVDDEKNVLEAKIAEMDRMVASKQTEIGRVREKAKSYLKEMNAEMKTMEEKNKNSIDELAKQIEKERGTVAVMEQKAENASKEVDNCLAVIREKQKSMQMLRMNITSQKKAAEEAKQETETLRSEFLRYKERARLVLQEKENDGGITEANVDQATANVRAELERSRKESHELRKRVESLRRMEMSIDEMRERAERAETVADLLRKDVNGGGGIGGLGMNMNMNNTNFSQVDRLEEKIVKLEHDISLSKSETEDAKARHVSTNMRLESTERALLAAEVRARNLDTKAKKHIEALKSRIKQLEIALKRSQEASAAAQRTATAAAKAMSFPSSVSSTAEEDGYGNGRNKRDNDRDLNSGASDRGNNGLQENGAYDSLEIETSGPGRSRPRSTLAVALEDHTDKILSPRRNDGNKNQSNDGISGKNAAAEAAADAEARDQQIAVLTTQLAELGALFDEVQRESELRGEQMELLKTEVKNLDAKLASAEKLKNGAPFSYLRTIVVRYLETDDPTLLPVICNVLSFSDDEAKRIKTFRGAKAAASSSSGYFSIPFLGTR